MELKPDSGQVEVELPGTASFIALSQVSALPVGTMIDASHGKVVLVDGSGAGGQTKSGTFSGGEFVARQGGAGAPVRLILKGGNFGLCRAAVTHSVRALASTLRGKPRRPKVVRQLWGSDSGGNFVTVGDSASATVRGTVWLTQDRCDGTLVKVTRGAVVVHDRVRHRNVLVRAGHSLLVRANA